MKAIMKPIMKANRIRMRYILYLLIALASLMPAFVLAPWLAQQAHGWLLDRSMMAEEVFHKQAEVRLAAAAEKVVAVLRTKADSVALHMPADNTEHIQLLLEPVLRHEPVINSLALYGPDGVAITSVHEQGHSPASLDANAPEIAVPLHGRVFIGGPRHLEDHHYEIVISVPLSGAKGVIGVLAASVRISELWQQVLAVLPLHESRIYLIDSRGTLLIDPAGSKLKHGMLLSDSGVVRRLLTGQMWNEKVELSGFEQHQVYAIGSVVDTLKWGIISEIPAAQIQAPVFGAIRTLTLLVFALHILFGLLAIYYSRRLITPISRLVGALDRAGSGNYDEQISGSNYAEIDILNRHFNNMITTIAEREAELGKITQAIEQAGEAVVIADRNGAIEYANPAFFEGYGIDGNAVAGLMVAQLISDEDAAQFRSCWDALLDGSPWSGHLKVCRSDGTALPADISMAPVHSDHVVIICRDISQQQVLEEQLAQARKMESLGTLVGGIAHDFNNMLAGMTGNLYMAKTMAGNNPALIEKIDAVEGLSFRAADLISHLLAFARKSPVTMERIELDHFLDDMLKILRAGVPEDIAFDVIRSEESLPVLGDKTQIHQMLINLLNNARDAVAGCDEPEITLKLDQCVVTDDLHRKYPEAEAGRSYARISIRDNGHGIPEQEQARIFEPFFTTKEVGKGSGLGLSMIYGAMQMHQGFVDLRSSSGSGSCFSLFFPLRSDLKADALVSAAKASEGSGEKILLVDDQAELRAIMAEVLETQGYEAIEAANGEQGLEMFQQHGDIRLVITDVVMPVMGGVEMVAGIRERAPEMPVLFVTGYDRTLLEGKINRDNSLIMSKPLDFDRLAELIATLINSTLTRT